MEIRFPEPWLATQMQTQLVWCHRQGVDDETRWRILVSNLTEKNPESQQCILLGVSEGALRQLGHKGSDLNNGLIYRLIQNLSRLLGGDRLWTGSLVGGLDHWDCASDGCLSSAHFLFLYFPSASMAARLHPVSVCLVTVMHWLSFSSHLNLCHGFSQVFATAVQGWLARGIKKIQQRIY